MLILAFDTAGNGCSVCLWNDGAVLAGRADAMARGQAEALVPMIEEVMGEAGAAYADLDRIAVTVGPGSFTGLRVGVATARGLGLALMKPVWGVTTTEAFAHAVPVARRTAGTVLAAIDARRDDVYLQAFRAPDMTPLADAVAALPESVPALLALRLAEAPVIACGDAAERLAGLEGVAEVLPQPVIEAPVVAAIAATRPLPPGPPSALYVRPPDAALPVNGGRLRP